METFNKFIFYCIDDIIANFIRFLINIFISLQTIIIMLSYKKSRRYVHPSGSPQTDIYGSNSNNYIPSNNFPEDNMDLKELTSRPNYGEIFYRSNNQYNHSPNDPN